MNSRGVSQRCMPKDKAKMPSASWVLKAAGLSGAAAIALGAFGAHGLKGRVDPNMLKAGETGSHYHLCNSAGAP